MQFQSNDGNAFSMSVVGYEFPGEELGPTEDNPADEFEPGRFLVVAVHFSDSGRNWSASGPIMHTGELEHFISWLSSIAGNQCSKVSVYFTERDLEFSFDANRNRLGVHIFRDFLPEWHDRDSLTLEFPISGIELPAVIGELRDQQRLFPGRPPIEDGV